MSDPRRGAILVGGRSSRMGGAPKGLVDLGGETPLARLTRALVLDGVPPLLVGDVEAYGEDRVSDAVRDSGPLAGWVAALRAVRRGTLVVVACDMPAVDARTIERLLAAEPRDRAAAAHDGARFVPTLARLPVERTLPVAEARLARGDRSLVGVLAELDALPVAFAPHELVDLDTPEDVARWLGRR